MLRRPAGPKPSNTAACPAGYLAGYSAGYSEAGGNPKVGAWGGEAT
jgi:hypothetical protein